MKHHITTIIAFAAALLLQVSCYDLRFGDAFLGEHPESSGATLDTLFSSAANADRVLTKAYSYLPYGLPTGKDNGHAYDKLGVNILESITDLNNSRRENVSDGPRNLYYSGAYGSNIASDSRGCEAYRFGEENEYSAIRYAWIYIENADRVPDLSSVDRQRKVAEAKMVIAIAYSEMLRYMGGVPLLKHSVEENEEMYFPRATFAETVDYIVQLLDEAAPYLNWKNDGTENGRMTKAGALGLKLRILLWAASPTFNSDTPWHPQADAYTCYGNYDRERWKRAMDAGEEFFDELDANGGYQLTQAESQTHAGYRAAFRSAYYDRGGTEILITTRRGYNVDILDGFMSQANQSGPTLNYVNMFAWADGTGFPEDYDWEHPGNETRQPFFDASGNPTREPRLYETVAVPGDTWKDGSKAPVFTNSQKYVAGVGFLQKKFILDTDTLIDVQVKRIHEYKRQLMNALNILMIYERLKNDSAFAASFPPTTFLFGGKAAPGYVNAKLIIKFINNIAHVINHDPAVRGKLSVFFMPNYRVTMAENVIPCTNISEQISTAGLEASGTGNMKFMINGALTMGTLDGANVEIAEEVGDDNIFIFGHTEEQIAELKKDYNPLDWVNRDPLIRRVIDLCDSNHFNLNEPNIFEPLRRALFDYGDKYCIFADLRMYHDRHNEATDLYRDDFDLFNRKAIINIASSAKFSSDRTISEYAEDIWHVKPCPVKKSTKDTVLEDAFNPLFRKEKK